MLPAIKFKVRLSQYQNRDCIQYHCKYLDTTIEMALWQKYKTKGKSTLFILSLALPDLSLHTASIALTCYLDKLLITLCMAGPHLGTVGKLFECYLNP